MRGTTGQEVAVRIADRVVLARPAAELRAGDGLLLRRDEGMPFGLVVLRAENWRPEGDPAVLVWSRVVELHAPSGREGVYSIALCCEVMAAGSLAVTVLSDALVVTDPRSPL
ncbi:hypothetical protein FHS43_004459 [Streptosporangium becharense]|uniref:Uncharacterized protein n=1 Tax=Streptosporangium becharense TaxID=1816182 RepID=A0A7W9IL74_9ACTN|nr:hypothetical protein [Streptosporangium becharense]MBB2913161.1 hypothetical protein [Streptosporangium becharense]MBB5822144.1 hypothetical protein [Streptosporangium becharense]